MYGSGTTREMRSCNEARPMLEAMKTSGTNDVSLEEFVKLIREGHDCPLSDEELEKRFYQADAEGDGDGRLSQARTRDVGAHVMRAHTGCGTRPC